ncbi:MULTISPECIES: GPO family capsid scaffolding protein [Citrobacter]|uniref:GPO family capsid scaffolding protein n=1 Tax=Citrobacter TaxID=544 RepID=UPI000DF105A3|nr:MULTISPECIES: GPO family capsid scaffolding protein [Citrobacter]MBJ9818751.1 GPO family capsid scaffolding protein [Citrobacter koseri]MDM3001257.1 GPO family capsid scaffolding protein [Citrobacter sp. CK192]MDM3023194.1 GPO family capsid scaffolding protein [Citrobacter sp. CK193]MDT7495561.1 GPO family capsid scaffolding protein [Citrobacter koseri]MEC5643059.1 GPO family capsid scaffolding protein [Citrobacter koseri]
MSGSQLATNWICIATAGETVDKRTIEEQWLLDAAELYDPNLYTALLWPEHTRNFGNMGEVLEVKAERDDEDILRLYARLCPAISLLQANAKGQLLFLSPEFTPDGNFRNTGKTYLEGLAITDSPAGVSTTRLRFSRTKGKRIGPYKPLAFDEVREFKKEKGMSQAKKGWRHFFSIEEPEQTPDQDKTPSDAMQALAEALDAIEKRVSAIESRLDTAEEAVSDVQDDVDTVKDVVDTEDFARLVGNLPELVKNFSKLNNKVTQLPDKKFSKGKKGFNFL